MDEVAPLPNNRPTQSIRKSAYNRTNLFLTPCSSFKEIKGSSLMTRSTIAAIYHNTQSETSSACWHCCHSFDTTPTHLPRIYDQNERVYHTYGTFCSPNCGKAYILEHATFDKSYQINIFIRMMKDVYGVREEIVEAPPRIALNMFGGPFAIEKFRKKNTVCTLITPPFVSYCMLVEEKIRTIDEEISQHTTINKLNSVKGLRRPHQQVVIAENTPIEESPYDTFVKTQQQKSNKRLKTDMKQQGLNKFASSSFEKGDD